MGRNNVAQLMGKEVFIAIRDGAGTGSQLDPLNGSTPTALDTILADPALAGATIHFGPGLFRTRGFNGARSTVVVRSRQRWMGAGMYSTTLQLVDGVPKPGFPTDRLAVVGAQPWVDGFEISDLTLDANLSRQPKV